MDRPIIDGSPTPREQAALFIRELDVLFEHHPPTEEQARLYPQVRSAFKQCAFDILRLAPHSNERNVAMRALQEAMFWTNAAIARRWRLPPEPEPVGVDMVKEGDTNLPS